MVSRFGLGRFMAALVVAVMVVPGAAFAQQDLRSPDAQDAAAAAAPAVSTDLRTPDTRDLAGAVPLTFADWSSDPVSPDGRDAATGRQVISNPIVTPAPVAGDTFDWGDAAIGAAAMLAFALVLGGAALLLTRRRRIAPAVSMEPRGVGAHDGRVRRGAHARRHTAAR